MYCIFETFPCITQYSQPDICHNTQWCPSPALPYLVRVTLHPCAQCVPAQGHETWWQSQCDIHSCIHLKFVSPLATCHAKSCLIAPPYVPLASTPGWVSKPSQANPGYRLCEGEMYTVCVCVCTMPQHGQGEVWGVCPLDLNYWQGSSTLLPLTFPVRNPGN